MESYEAPTILIYSPKTGQEIGGLAWRGDHYSFKPSSARQTITECTLLYIAGRIREENFRRRRAK